MVENYTPDRGLRDTLYLKISTDTVETDERSNFGFQPATKFTGYADLMETQEPDGRDAIAWETFNEHVFRDAEVQCGYEMDDQEWEADRAERLARVEKDREEFAESAIAYSRSLAVQWGYDLLRVDCDGEITWHNLHNNPLLDGIEDLDIEEEVMA